MIDTHAHLTDEAYRNTQQELIESFKQDNLDKVFTVGFDLQSSIDCVNLAEKHENIYAIIGVHPENCKQYNEEAEQKIVNLAKSNKVIAIGEIGLDYHYEGYDKQSQKETFVKQMKLAYQLHLPIVIHLRDAVGDFIEIMKQHQDYLKYGVLIHCFSESLESYKIFEKMGFNVAIGGSVTFKNATRLQEVVKNIPLEKIVLETDCPYLAPTPYRGQLNFPKNVLLVAEKIAELKKCSLQEVLDKTTENVYNIFPKVKK